MVNQQNKKRSEEEVTSLLHRLNRLEGQIRGIKKMVEAGAYCPDILVQSAAVRSALDSFNKKLLSRHLRMCVAEDIQSNHTERLEEFVVLMQKFLK